MVVGRHKLTLDGIDSVLTKEKYHSILSETCNTLWFDLWGEWLILQQDNHCKHTSKLCNNYLRSPDCHGFSSKFFGSLSNHAGMTWVIRFYTNLLSQCQLHCMLSSYSENGHGHFTKVQIFTNVMLSLSKNTIQKKKNRIWKKCKINVFWLRFLDPSERKKWLMMIPALYK